MTGYQGKIDGTLEDDYGKTYPIVAGTKNEYIFGYDHKLLNTTITLEDYTPESYKSWMITGVPDYKITDDVDNQSYNVVAYIDEEEEEEWIPIKIQGNKLVLSLKFPVKLRSFDCDSTITLTPIFSSAGFTATASSTDPEQGTAEAAATSNANEFTLTATGADGYSFDYWVKDGAEDAPENRIYVNPYTLTLTEDAAYTAHFRARYAAPTVTADEREGEVSAKYVGASNHMDRWELTATPATLFNFDRWTWGEDGESTDNPAIVDVPEEGVSIEAHFSDVQFALLDGGMVEQKTVADNYINPGSLWESRSTPPVGGRAALYVPFQADANVDQAQYTFYVKNGDKTIISRTIGYANLQAGKPYYAKLVLDPVPDTDTLHVDLNVRTELANTDAAEQTYTIQTAASQTNSDYHYLTSPNVSQGTGNYTVESGPNAAGVYGQVDENTKEPELYVYGNNGVYALTQDGDTDLTDISNGLPSVPAGFYDGVYAIGPDGNGGLIAAVDREPIQIDAVTTPGYDASAWTGDIYGQQFLYQWDRTSWKQIPNSCFSNFTVYQGNVQYNQAASSGKAALILSANDVWTNNYHWDGAKWSKHDYDFASFTRVGSEIFATDTNRTRWKYTDGAWSHTDAAEMPSAGSLGSDAVIAQDYTGAYYALSPNGRYYSYGNGYSDTSIYKWDGSDWVYQIMTDFDDPQEDINDLNKKIRPAGVTAMATPIPGVSVMYGSRGAGAIYMAASDVTITFDAQGGTFRDESLKTLTGKIFDEISSDKVPSVSRTGYSFGGWYYDSDCKTAWSANNAIMPDENITLYAKWTERGGSSGGTDDDPEMAYYREQALASLDKQFSKYSKSDYTEANWNKLLAAYEQGKKNINAAKPASDYIENNIIAALNKALAAMQEVPADRSGSIDVVVSMDANTLGLGYLIKPTLVSVSNRTPASEVITNLIEDMAREEFGVTNQGLSSKGENEPNGKYPWIISGSIDNSFYLAQVYYPKQKDVKIADYILKYVKSSAIMDSDRDGNYLGEFDYTSTSGWMYSISDGSEITFPGVGASAWQLSDGEVMRWQFTVYGYGADLDADNSAWGTSSIVSVGDKTSLTWDVAELRDSFSDDTLEANSVYQKAMEVLTNPEASQSDINKAQQNLAKEKFSNTPNTNGGSGGSSTTTTQVEPEIKADKNGVAKAELSTSDINSAISSAKKDGSGTLVIAPKITGDATKVTVELPKSGAQDIVDNINTAFAVKLPTGTVQIPNKTLASIVSNAAGDTIQITVETKKLDSIKDKVDAADLDKAIVAEVSITSGGKAITDFGGQSLTVDLPVDNNYTENQSYKVILINADGKQATLSGRCMKVNGQLVVRISTAQIGIFVVTNEKMLSFTDVQDSDYFYDAVLWAVGQNITSGTSTTTFSPNASCTRAQMVTFLWRAVGSPAPTSQTSSFTDVQTDTYYYKALLWAVENGITSGTTATTFSPDAACTRGQMATFLYRNAKSPAVSGQAAFTDVTSSDYFSTAVAWAAQQGITSGTTATTFSPNAACTRGQMVAFLYRYLAK